MFFPFPPKEKSFGIPVLAPLRISSSFLLSKKAVGVLEAYFGWTSCFTKIHIPSFNKFYKKTTLALNFL